ncbi:kinase-like domain-containing protein [Mycena rebaudengoi]|nr:kinase-like domain-containing protein [Mycena rebaudengoi]
MTQSAKRLRFEPDDLKIRLGTASLLFSTTLSIPQNILAPLHITLDEFPFTIMAHVGDPDHQKHPASGNFECKEFWAHSNLENWLLARSQDLCHALWHTSSDMTTLERVQSMYLILNGSPENFLPMYTYYLGLKQSAPRDMQYQDVKASLMHGGFLKSLLDYQSDFKRLFTLLNARKQSMENGATTHITSTNVFRDMKLCLSVGVAGLVFFLQDRQSYKEFLTYRGTDAQTLLDLLQDFLDLDSFSVVKPLIFKALCSLSRVSGLHPRCFALTELEKVGQQVGGGGFGDIWKGLVGGQIVCVKIMRIFGDHDVQTLLKEFGREAIIWRQLCHPNLLPFFGLYHLENRLCLVSPWMENGNVMEFLRKEPLNIGRLSLILDVALGLEYLHEQKIVHGDLKGINILVTPSQRACIADFGLSSIVNAMTLRLTTSTATANRGTARYQAPELFQPGEEETTKTFESDIYSFACVCYEILTGRLPFYEFPNDLKIMLEVIAGKRPSRSLSCSGTIALDTLWELLQKCWDGQAEKRPTAAQIVEQLTGPSIRATTFSKTDWDDKLTSKFRRSLHTGSILPSATQIERILLSEEVAEACKEVFSD